MKKAMLIYEDKEMKHWRIACTCGIREHDIELTVEKGENKEIWTWVDLRTQVHVDGFWNRIKQMASILFHGRTLDMYETFMFDEENAAAFISALKESMAEVKDNSL